MDEKEGPQDWRLFGKDIAQTFLKLATGVFATVGATLLATKAIDLHIKSKKPDISFGFGKKP